MIEQVTIIFTAGVFCTFIVVALVKLSTHPNVKRFYKWLLG